MKTLGELYAIHFEAVWESLLPENEEYREELQEVKKLAKDQIDELRRTDKQNQA